MNSQIRDYTAGGTSNMLFDFNRFIAVADHTTNSYNTNGFKNHFLKVRDFANAIRLAPGHVIEGVVVVDIRINDNKSGGPKYSDADDALYFPFGVNVRGALFYNFGAEFGPLDKFVFSAALNINAADLSGFNRTNPATFTTGYPPVYTDWSKCPTNINISLYGYTNFTAADDLPALMSSIGEVDLHGPANVCGVLYTPSFMEIENKEPFGCIQYFRGAIIAGAGIYLENTNGNGASIFSCEPSVVTVAARSSYNLALRADGRVAAWGDQTDVPAGLTNVSFIAAGVSHNLALVDSGPPPATIIVANSTREAGQISIKIPTQSGKVYRLEYKNSLASDTWTALPLVAGNGVIQTLTDSTSNDDQRFYRVRQW